MAFGIARSAMIRSYHSSPGIAPGATGWPPRPRAGVDKDRPGQGPGESLDGWALPIIIIVFRAERVKDDEETVTSWPIPSLKPRWRWNVKAGHPTMKSTPRTGLTGEQVL